MFLNNRSIVGFSGGRGREGQKIDVFCGHHKCKTPKLVRFYDVQISRIKKEIHHEQGQKSSIKCAYRDRGSKLMAVCTHMDYPLSD